jgi:glycosyltransferase involved in cell wall biosynthesis
MTSYSKEELDTVRTELNLGVDDFALVTTSRLVHKNGIDDVIRALVLLPPHVKFIVFGVGPDEEKLKKLITELDLSSRVQLRGQIGHAVMPKYLKACNAFIRPSRSEGMGNSFVEAMAAGLPVIATQEGGIADFLFDVVRNPTVPTTGWAVSKDTPAEIATAVMDIMNHPETVVEVTVRAQKMAIAKYDWDLVAARMDAEVFKPLWK